MRPPYGLETYDDDVSRVGKVLAWAAGLFALLLVLILLEGSGGHDGYLCEWGYDIDGERMGDSGCG